MQFNKKTITAIGSLLAAITVAATTVTPVFAAGLGLGLGVKANTNVQVNLGTAQAKGDTAIDSRVTALNSLQTRVNQMAKISAGQKTSLTAAIQSSLQDMATLKAKIDADTTAAALKLDIAAITKDNRIYALIIPQGRIEASADREQTIISLMDTLGTKLQTRIAADASFSNASAMQNAYADFQAKVSDADNQSQASVNLVANLQPDQGNATVLASNNAALKQAAQDIKTATADLKAARQDISTITVGLKADETTKASAKK